MTTPRSNRGRAARAGGVLESYAGGAGDDEASLTDLMTDIRHWCRISGVGFERATISSQRHFAAELAEERRDET